jgi:phosphoglycerate dehydrogenase-like enzyme
VLKISVPHTVTWEDSDWARLRTMGDVVHWPGYPSSEADLIARIGRADIIVGADVEFSAEVIYSNPNLKMISIWSTGYNNVDLEVARQRRIVVSNVPGYSAYSVAEHTWAMVLYLAKRLAAADAHVRHRQFDWSAIRGLELFGKIVGIIGTGAIGTRSAAIARGFGCRVLACTKHPSPLRAEQLGLTYVSLRDLLAKSDIILLHAPLTSETRHMINGKAFRQMTRKPILVNTARGAIIEMAALIRALDEGHISGLGLDVMWDEPPDWEAPAVQRLLRAENVVLSPHCGSHTREAFQRLTKVCLDNIEAFLNGTPTNVVV